MDPLSALFGISAACYHFSVSCNAAWDTVHQGRRVEALLSDFQLEETIYNTYRNHFACSVGLDPASSQDRDRALWCNASIRTALETNLGFGKAHALLENLRETEDGINDVYEISSVASQGRRYRSHQHGEVMRQAILKYLRYKGRILPSSCSVEEMLRLQIKHIKCGNKNTARLFWCPNLLQSPRENDAALEDTLSGYSEPVILSAHTTKLPSQSTKTPTITQQIKGLLALDLLPNTPSPTLTSPLHPASPPNTTAHEITFSIPNRPASLAWWQILLAAPNRNFFITQFLLFIIGIGVVIGWFMWKRDLGTATGCGGLVFALGSTANMVWDKCSSGVVVEGPLRLTGS